MVYPIKPYKTFAEVGIQNHISKHKLYLGRRNSTVSVPQFTDDLHVYTHSKIRSN